MIDLFVFMYLFYSLCQYYTFADVLPNKTKQKTKKRKKERKKKKREHNKKKIIKKK